MDDKELKQKFLDEIKKTEELIEEYRELTKPIAPDVAIGRVSRMDAINNKSINDSALRNAEEKLRKLKYAMSKVGSPQFGICGKCGGTIPVGRILIKPESMYCVNCAQ
ncbi:MAG: TraR/DksA family transcriptional regulator [Cryomorphaceae bacterium]|nr:TraR/DksA C4-type zinc finger protein [Flavobacteriales bacterium]